MEMMGIKMEKNYRHELTGLFGSTVDENPVGVMTEAGFKALNLNYRYLNMQVSEESLETAIKSIRVLGFKGVNLTIPHKVKAIPYLDALTETAQIIGAVNVVVNKDGKLIGDNTDGIGFLLALHKADVDVKDKKLFMIGAGGAGRAVAVSCALNGARRITVANRSEDRGKELVSLLKEKTPIEASFVHWTGTLDIPKDTDILINVTSIGLFPDVNKPNIDYDAITENMVCCDVIFNPAKTGFLAEAEKRKAKIIDGLGMLAYQGAKAFELWTGIEAPVDIFIETLAEEFE